MAVSPLDGVTGNTLTKLLFAQLCQILVSYGIYFTLNVICLHYLVRNKKRNYVIVVYTVLSLIASTTFVTTMVKSTEAFFIPEKNAQARQRTTTLIGLISYESKLCLADSLLAYRLWVIYDGAWLFVLFPLALLTGTLGILLAHITIVASNDFNDTAINLGVALHSCSVTFNISATSMIIVRLWKKRKWAKNLGLDHAKVYLSMTAIFAESGVLYAVVGGIYIPLIVINKPITYFYGTWMDFAAGITPLLILLRLAFGVAISRRTLTTLGTEINGGQQRTNASKIEFSPVGNDIDPDIDSFAGQREEV